MIEMKKEDAIRTIKALTNLITPGGDGRGLRLL